MIFSGFEIRVWIKNFSINFFCSSLINNWKIFIEETVTKLLAVYFFDFGVYFSFFWNSSSWVLEEKIVTVTFIDGLRNFGYLKFLNWICYNSYRELNKSEKSKQIFQPWVLGKMYVKIFSNPWKPYQRKLG